jgi:hypothetical protein
MTMQLRHETKKLDDWFHRDAELRQIIALNAWDGCFMHKSIETIESENELNCHNNI